MPSLSHGHILEQDIWDNIFTRKNMFNLCIYMDATFGNDTYKRNVKMNGEKSMNHIYNG